MKLTEDEQFWENQWKREGIRPAKRKELHQKNIALSWKFELERASLIGRRIVETDEDSDGFTLTFDDGRKLSFSAVGDDATYLAWSLD